jgi:DNA-binding transcriptional ArsR family regulator
MKNKPVAWYHPASKRVRWEGSNLPPSWVPLYHAPRKMNVSMNAIEKVERFLKERKSPVSTKVMADYFLMSMSAIQRALKELENAGKAQRKRKANTHYWTWKKETAQLVAVPRGAVELSIPSAYSRPLQNSYPQIRGYDD